MRLPGWNLKIIAHTEKLLKRLKVVDNNISMQGKVRFPLGNPNEIYVQARESERE